VPPDPIDLRAIWQPAFGKRYHLQSVDYQRGERGHSVNLFAPFTEGVLRPSMRGDGEAIHIAALLFLLACLRCLALRDCPASCL